jgi:hypothetical protein
MSCFLSLFLSISIGFLIVASGRVWGREGRGSGWDVALCLSPNYMWFEVESCLATCYHTYLQPCLALLPIVLYITQWIWASGLRRRGRRNGGGTSTVLPLSTSLAPLCSPQLSPFSLAPFLDIPTLMPKTVRARTAANLLPLPR